jgi:hypothetical protein
MQHRLRRKGQHPVEQLFVLRGIDSLARTWLSFKCVLTVDAGNRGQLARQRGKMETLGRSSTKRNFFAAIILGVVVSALIPKATILPEPPPDQVILGAVVDHYAGQMDPQLKEGEVIIVSRNGCRPWLTDDWYNERDAKTIVKSWTQLGASADLVEEIKREEASPPRWNPKDWTSRTPIRDDKTFSENWGGLETMGECLQSGGPSRTVLHFSRPYIDPRTGYLFVVVHDWFWPPSMTYKLYKLGLVDDRWQVIEEVEYDLAGF